MLAEMSSGRQFGHSETSSGSEVKLIHCFMAIWLQANDAFLGLSLLTYRMAIVSS